MIFQHRGATEFVGGVQVNSGGVGGVVGMDFAHTSSVSPAEGQSRVLAASPLGYILNITSGTSTGADPDPNCSRGLRAGTFCCPKNDCNVCGGKTCSTPPNVGGDWSNTRKAPTTRWPVLFEVCHGMH